MNVKNMVALPPITVSRKDLGRLIASLFFIVVFLLPHIPVWAAAGCFLVGIWRYTLMVKNKPVPPPGLRVALTLGAFLAIYVHYHSILGRDPGITALVLLSAMKLIELRSVRDFLVVIFLCAFLVLGVSLYNQSILTLILMVVMVLALTATAVGVNRAPDRDEKPRFGELKKSLPLVLMSLPLVIVLFLFFPRSTGPLWDLPQGGTGFGRSGFSDIVRPGYVAWLAQSYETAFRVTFPDDNMPGFRNLYFRGLVLWFTDGRAWFHGFFPFRKRPQKPPSRDAIHQKIFLEPHYSRYLFALDKPVGFPPWAGQLPGWCFRTEKPVERVLRYEVFSELPRESPSPLHPALRRWSLQLPNKLNPRILELGRGFKNGADSDREIINRVLNFFDDPAFKYTLQPGLLDRKDPIADFLFRSRKGFCEHFASAFAVLTRVAGVPARVVVGFHGGKYNPIGGYLEIRKADAHAWNEVWLEDTGWRRIDPTAVVSPERIEYGAEISRSISSLDQVSDADRSEIIRRRLHRGFFKKVWETIENFWDNISSNWNYWVIGFDRDQQETFLEDLGLVDLGGVTLVIFMLVLSGGVMLLMALLLKRRFRKTQPLNVIYHRFCMKMERRGVKRFSHEGPLDFKSRSIKTFPDKSRAIGGFVSLFIDLKYGKTEITSARLKRMREYLGRM